MPSELVRHWTLDPDVLFLNHGSFGATPRPVLDAQARWRERMEREPVAFFAQDLEGLLDGARGELGAFVGADPDDLAFVPNATTGINVALAGLRLEPGDEVLTTDHAYGAARNALAVAAERAGARVVTAALPYPGTTPEAARDAILAAVTPRTRLALLDHVTSPTALVLPIGELVALLEERGVDTLIDAAHAPGMVELDLDAIGAAFATGNCHKWMCAPKGSAFLHVRRDRQEAVRPIVISHGATSARTDRSRYRLEHDWTGTLDPTPWLSVPAAITFGAGLMPGGWPALMARNTALALEAMELLCRATGTPRPVPDAMVGAMVSLPLPPTDEPVPVESVDDRLHAALLRDGMQVAVASWPQRPVASPWQRLVRVSCAPYVDRADIERLARSILGVLAAA